MTTAFDHLFAFALEHPWAITADMLGRIAGILADRVAGVKADASELAALATQRQALPQAKRGGGVALIPVQGVLAPRMNLMSEMSGGATFQQLAQAVAAALADPEVKTLVFDVDSPGGNVAGASEFHKILLKARAQKPCIASVNYLCASAAYWTMSAATKIIAAPSAQIGGIGVLAIYDDLTAALEQRGIKRKVLSAGRFKGEALGGPLSAEADAHLQGLIDQTYGRMTTDIALGRSVKVATVRGGYGEGFCILADTALAAGMIDEIATLEETLARLGVTAASASLSAATDQEPLAATSQERAVNALWHNAILGEVLALDL